MATSDVVTMGISKLVTNNAIASLVSDQICDTSRRQNSRYCDQPEADSGEIYWRFLTVLMGF
jgi:hypothetical protein